MSSQYLPWSSHISTPPSLPYYHLPHHYHSLSLICYNFRQFSSFLAPMTGWGYQNYQAKMKSFSVAICKESLFLFVVIRLISVSLLLRIGGTRALKRGISPSKLLSQVCSKGEVVSLFCMCVSVVLKCPLLILRTFTTACFGFWLWLA